MFYYNTADEDFENEAEDPVLTPKALAEIEKKIPCYYAVERSWEMMYYELRSKALRDTAVQVRMMKAEDLEILVTTKGDQSSPITGSADLSSTLTCS